MSDWVSDLGWGKTAELGGGTKELSKEVPDEFRKVKNYYFWAWTKGIDLHTDKRISSYELALLKENTAPDLEEDEYCILGSVLGGALERGQTQGSGVIDYLFSWAQSDAISAQTTCRTDITWEQVMEKLGRKSPEAVRWFNKKKDLAQSATTASYDVQRKQDTAKVIQAEADAVANVGNAASNLVSWSPAIVAAAVVIAAGVAAFVLAKKAT